MRTADLVLEFMMKHNQFYQSTECLPPPSVGLLRIRLIGEELGELAHAIHTNNIVEAADALGDLEYVVAGTALAMGLDHTFVATDAVDVQVFDLEIQRLWHLRELYYTFGQFCSAMGMSDLAGCRLNLENMSSKTQEFAYSLRIPLATVFKEVHRSNMTKAPLDKNNKGGKVDKIGYEPPQIAAILRDAGHVIGV